MDNPYTGEVSIEIGGKACVIVFDWRAISQVNATLGNEALQHLLASGDPEKIASLLEIGLQRHHPEMTKDIILDSSPPLMPTFAALNRALAFAYWGPDEVRTIKDAASGHDVSVKKKTT